MLANLYLAMSRYQSLKSLMTVWKTNGVDMIDIDSTNLVLASIKLDDLEEV